jgi:hypothetical protein
VEDFISLQNKRAMEGLRKGASQPLLLDKSTTINV